jgi:hypothetical protein
MTVDLDRGAAGAGRRRIDWRKAAELIATGTSAATVVRLVECSYRQLSRRRQSPEFQDWVAEFREATLEHRRDRLGELRRAVHKSIEHEVKNNNVRVVLWLADRLKLITPPSERTPEQELRQILDSLSADELSEFERLRDPA